MSESVYGRMRAERTRAANTLRSTGAAESEKIRADADKQREVILAQAYRDAQRLKGEGDAKAMKWDVKSQGMGMSVPMHINEEAKGAKEMSVKGEAGVVLNR